MKWTLEKRDVTDLYQYAKNARSLSKAQATHLSTSIEKFGQCEPLVINRDGTVIGGHQRLRVMRGLGHKTVDVYVPSELLSSKQVAELNIRLNKNVGDWDWEMLANAWEPSDLIDWGFTEKELHLDGHDSPENADQEAANDKDSARSTLVISFASVEDLQDAENRISVIVDEYTGASCKAKIS